MFNSKYDAWQLANEFQSNWETKEEQVCFLPGPVQNTDCHCQLIWLVLAQYVM